LKRLASVIEPNAFRTNLLHDRAVTDLRLKGRATVALVDFFGPTPKAGRGGRLSPAARFHRLTFASIH